MHRDVVLALSVLLSCASCASSSGAAGAASGAADPAGGQGADAAKIEQARAQLDEVTSAWSRFTFAYGRCPQGIDDLVHPPGGEALLAAAPVDPWGQPVAFMPASEESPSPQLVSAGPDATLLTDDDLRARATCTEP